MAAGWIAIALFMVGVVYQAGRLSARLEALEQWRGEVIDRLDKIGHAIDRLEAFLRNGRE